MLLNLVLQLTHSYISFLLFLSFIPQKLLSPSKLIEKGKNYYSASRSQVGLCTKNSEDSIRKVFSVHNSCPVPCYQGVRVNERRHMYNAVIKVKIDIEEMGTNEPKR